ncbi:gamma-glutamyltransferase [Candidimonas sp. SYP-B2681]|uniref:gamma-glutamyltransferase n=1 Tax=Candidimonas sp. SYP-B2681 TaxID=2497686 RepID=UPI001315635E|nr:gamma-glutamyltransferase [Candidimonas sp. SYP-B2681]
MGRMPQYQLPESRAMIVAPQPEAVFAGADILRAGGNALDAAIACAMTQGVVDPLMCGVGGFGLLHIYDPSTGINTVYEGFGGCPAESRADMWKDIALGDTVDGFGFIVKDFINEAGAMSVTAPGLLKLLAAAHHDMGSVPWAALFDSAIAYAREGWIVRPHVYTVFTQDESKYGRMNYGDKLGLTEDGRRIYLEPDGGYKRPGAFIRNPDLAGTLETLAKEGADSFYTGSLAKRIIEDVRRNGGILSHQDLAEFQIYKSVPLNVDYRGWRVAMPGPPGGGTLVAQILKIFERFDPIAIGFNSVEYIRILTEAMKIALRDKEQFIGDPRFSENPIDWLLSDAYIDECAQRIRRGDKTDVPRRRAAESQHTTHVSAVDANGMVVSLTHTLGNPSGFIVKDTGLMLNGAMSTFDPIPGRPNSIEPGKRRYSSMVPTIVFDGNTPICSVGAPGASWIGPAVAQVLLNMLDWGMDMQEAVSAPRVVSTSNAIDISNRIPLRIQRSLEKQGYIVRRSHLSYAFAGVHGITMFDGVLRGGADPQRDGYAEGVKP